MGVPERQTDEVLLPLLSAPGPAEADALVTRILEDHAEPVLRDVIWRRLHVFLGQSSDLDRARDAEDVRGDVLVRLLARLREFSRSRGESPIANLRGYVATTAYNCCHEYLRARFPRRWSLKNSVRYWFAHKPGYAIWAGDSSTWWCGLEGWRGRSVAARPLDALAMAIPAHVTRTLDDLLPAILGASGSPVELDALVGLVAGLHGVSEEPRPVEMPEQIPSEEGNLATRAEQRQLLRVLWSEIRLLPVRQRVALLLNLRAPDGQGVIELLPLMGVATFRQITAALEFPVERLAEIWNSLPIDDERIAGLLGVSRQQVINLRKAARARLGRRLREIG